MAPAISQNPHKHFGPEKLFGFTMFFTRHSSFNFENKTLKNYKIKKHVWLVYKYNYYLSKENRFEK